MKLSRRFKRILYSTLSVLFVSGLVVWIFETWFQIDRGFGPEPHEARIWFLRLHAVFGLFFLMVFGALCQSHVARGLKGKKKKTSGLSTLSPILVLVATVPILYYVTDETLKSWTAGVHTYLGLASVIPFFVHLFKPKS